MNHRGHREDEKREMYFSYKSLGVLCGKYFFTLLAFTVLLAPIVCHGQDRQTTTRDNRLRYDLKLAINFDDRTYTGTEQVHWVNHGDRATSTIFFHLYPNMRPPDYVAPTQRNDAGQIIATNRDSTSLMCVLSIAKRRLLSRSMICKRLCD